MKRVWDRIREVREALGVDGQDVARAIGLSPSYYSMLESGKRPLRAEHVEQISLYLRIPVSKFYGEDIIENAELGDLGALLSLYAQQHPENRARLKRIIDLGLLTDEADLDAVERLAKKERQEGTAGGKQK